LQSIWFTVDPMRVEQLVELCEARLVHGDPTREVGHISVDSRTLGRGDCFVALRGPRFDGHKFISDAARLGASAAVVSDPTSATNSPSALALLQVQDTLTALHKLATNYRRLMPPTTRIIAISGACGKTTTKDMIAAVLVPSVTLIGHALATAAAVPWFAVTVPVTGCGVVPVGSTRKGFAAVPVSTSLESNNTA